MSPFPFVGNAPLCRIILIARLVFVKVWRAVYCPCGTKGLLREGGTIITE